MLGVPIAVGTKVRVSFVMGIHHCRRIGSTYTIFFFFLGYFRGTGEARIAPCKGKINRKADRWRCGYRNCEEANAAL